MLLSTKYCLRDFHLFFLFLPPPISIRFFSIFMFVWTWLPTAFSDVLFGFNGNRRFYCCYCLLLLYNNFISSSFALMMIFFPLFCQFFLTIFDDFCHLLLKWFACKISRWRRDYICVRAYIGCSLCLCS